MGSRIISARENENLNPAVAFHSSCGPARKHRLESYNFIFVRKEVWIERPNLVKFEKKNKNIVPVLSKN